MLESDYESAVTIHDMEKPIFTENDIKIIMYNPHSS